MNKKNIFFLFCLLIFNIHAISIRENIEKTRRELRTCMDRVWNSNCDQQEKAFSNAKREFINPLDNIITEGITSKRELSNNSKSYFPMRDATKKKLKEKTHLAYAASGIQEYLVGRNNGYFEDSYYNEKTIDEFCEESLNMFFKNHSGGYSSYASDIMGPLYITEEEEKEAKVIIRKIVKKILEQKSTQRN